MRTCVRARIIMCVFERVRACVCACLTCIRDVRAGACECVRVCVRARESVRACLQLIDMRTCA